MIKCGGDRYIVIDDQGNKFRANGFRRCECISSRVGEIIVKGLIFIEQGSTSVWFWRNNVKQLQEIILSLENNKKRLK